MEKIKNILILSRMDPYSRNTVNFGIALARKHVAKLHVLHLVTNISSMGFASTSGLFPEGEYIKFKNNLSREKEELDKIIKQEMQNGYFIKELISNHDSVEEIERVVREEEINLLIMPAHEEGRIERALFGGVDAAVIRRMPCSILLVKNEPGPVDW